MKFLIAFFFLFLGAQQARSDCAGGKYTFLNNGDTVNSNSVIAINLFARYQCLAHSEDNAVDFIIIGSDKSYPLEKLAIQTGYNQTQVIFKLPKKITKGHYKLGISPKSDCVKSLFITVKNKETPSPKIIGGVYITVEPAPDLSYLQKDDLSLHLLHSVNEIYGCGPARYNTYMIESPQVKDAIYEVTIDEGTENQQKAFVISHENKITIGHGMCSGTFKLESGVKYNCTIRSYSAKSNVFLSSSKINLEITG